MVLDKVCQVVLSPCGDIAYRWMTILDAVPPDINCFKSHHYLTNLPSLLALNCSCPNFFWNVLQVWMTGKDVYLQITWSWPDKTWNILCSYCLQWNTSQSKFRNHYFLFLFAFSILSQLFLIWGCIYIYIYIYNELKGGFIIKKSLIQLHILFFSSHIVSCLFFIIHIYHDLQCYNCYNTKITIVAIVILNQSLQLSFKPWGFPHFSAISF